jgi:segregation and condensation protein B
MPATPDPPFDPNSPGISLDDLAQAFAQAMGIDLQAEDAEGKSADAVAEDVSADGRPSNAPQSAALPASETEEEKEDTCPLSPRSILEAMLFIGNGDNRPLTAVEASELMRDVESDEIAAIIEDLNRCYGAGGAPYHIVAEGDGYRLTLRPEFRAVTDGFRGRVREARLSQAAIDVLALVAYQQPINNEKLTELRGKDSSHLLAHLVHRGLLKMQRPDATQCTPHYSTTDRFLKLFNLESIADLPHSEDLDPP